MKFTIKNIKIKLGFSFFAVIAVLLCFKINNIILYSITFAVFHEFGHLILIFAGGEKPSQISFSAFGMEIKRNNDVKLNYKMEILSALAGPFFNILIAVIFTMFYYFNHKEKLIILISVNLILGIFNLLPIFSLDGGRVLENSLLINHSPEKAEKILRLTSILTLIPLFFLGFYVLIISGYNFTLLLICFYLSALIYLKNR
ncbi:MAG: site-2 protease family protein [Oscillospiraceae bacterium]